jgi:hypothetical protein
MATNTLVDYVSDEEPTNKEPASTVNRHITIDAKKQRKMTVINVLRDYMFYIKIRQKK